jgi:cytidyltransferase-like protein
MMAKIPIAKAMVFGVFDHFHKGHEYFLSEARKKCRELTVVVTLPDIVELMKKRIPDHTLEERINALKNFNSSFNVVPGDPIMGEWKVLKTHTPDIIFLGYDQQGIAGELDKLGIPYEFIDSHFPEKYNSSLVRKS